jgi:hypothetical protein
VKIVIFNFYLIINFFNYSEIIYTQLHKYVITKIHNNENKKNGEYSTICRQKYEV